MQFVIKRSKFDNIVFIDTQSFFNKIRPKFIFRITFMKTINLYLYEFTIDSR